jgi:hypothetical protein
MAEEHTISGEEYMARQQQKDNRGKVTISAQTIGMVMAVVLLCGVSFYGGIAYQKGRPNSATALNGQTGQGTNAPGGMSGFQGRQMNGSVGAVTAIDSSSITVKNQRTSQDKTYTITSTTTVTNDDANASISDIKVGDTVMVQASTDDTSAATRILLNPSLGGGPSSQSSSSNNDSAQTN